VITVIGLGNIGLAIAARLVRRQCTVLGVDLSVDRRREWLEATGLEAAASLDDVPWAEVEMVVVLVRMTAQAEAVLSQLDRLPVRPGTAVLLMTTLELPFARGLDAYRDRPYRLVEASVSGGERGASEGRLTIMVAGPVSQEDEERLLETVAEHVIRFEAFGEPTTAKLLNNVAAAYNARALADLLVLGDEMGLDARRLYEVIVHSSGGSWMASAFHVLVDDLLDKDVALLREQLGGLPTVTLSEDADLVGRLARARALLVADTSAG
jgi:3-hydroxyisobutyrate dehydrogenase